MEEGLRVVLNLSNEEIKWMDLYTIVYNICAFNKQLIPRLYQNLEQFLADYTKNVTLQKLRGSDKFKDFANDKSLLKRYATLWEQFNFSATSINEIFKYMTQQEKNRASKECAKHYEVLSLMFQVWREQVCQGISNELINDIMKEIIEQRETGTLTTHGSEHARKAIQSFIDLSSGVGELEYYKEQFEEPFLAHITSYYAEFSAQQLESNSIADYSVVVKNSLDFESNFVKTFLLDNSEFELMAVCKGELIEKHLDKFFEPFNKILRKTVVEEKAYADVSRIYKLTCENSAAVQHYALATKEWISELLGKTRDTNFRDKNSLSNSCVLSFVTDVIEVFRLCTRVVNECMNRNSIIEHQKGEALTEFVNRDVNRYKMSEIFSMFCDYILRGKLKESEKEQKELLEDFVQLFSFVQDKDIFHESYRKYLAERLLAGSAIHNEEMEQHMLSTIKIHCGSQCTKKLEGMCNDMLISQKTNENYKQYLDANDPTIKPMLYVNVLNTIYWPIMKTIPVKISPSLKVLTESFSNFYKSTEKSKALHWKFHQGTCRVQVHCNGKTTLVDMSIFQGCILDLFNEKDTWTFSELKDATGLTHEELLSSLHRLVQGKYRLLRSDANYKSPIPVAPTTVTCNDVTTKWPRKFSICAKTQASLEQSAIDTREEIKVDRRHQIDAAIVRIMKSRRKMEFRDLIAETISQLSAHFKPDIKTLKTRIGSLTEQQYLIRDPENQSVFCYLN